MEASLGIYAQGSQVCPPGGALMGPGAWWAGLAARWSSSGGCEKTPGGISASSALLCSLGGSSAQDRDRSDPTRGGQRGWGRRGRGGRQEAWVGSPLGGFSFLLTFQQKSGSPGLSPQVHVAARGCGPFLWSGSSRLQSPSGSRVWRVSLLAVVGGASRSDSGALRASVVPAPAGAWDPGV